MCPGSQMSRMVVSCEDDDHQMIKASHILEVPFVRKNWHFPRFVNSLLLVMFMFVILTMVSTYPFLDVTINVQRGSSTIGNVTVQGQQPSGGAMAYDLLRYTTLDPSDLAEKSKIRQILEGTSPENAHRLLQNRYYNRDHVDSLGGYRGRMEIDHMDSYDRNIRPRRSYQIKRERWPADLSHPRFLPYLGKFRELLQTWARKKKYDPLVMKDLVASLKEPIDGHYRVGGSASGKLYRTCAVVGNSGILLNRSYGGIIDNHEMVMRLNNARIKNFEYWVGSKTTLSFVNSNILHTCARRQKCSCQTYATQKLEVPIVSYICQVAHFMDVAYCGAFHKAPLLVTDPRFDSLTTRIIRYYSLQHFFQKQQQQEIKGGYTRKAGNHFKTGYEEWSKAHDGALFHYSSGMQAVMLALGICEQVDIFGFGKLQNARHHYHTNQKGELSLHDYEAEYIFYDDLAAGRGNSIPFLNDSGILIPRVQIFH